MNKAFCEKLSHLSIEGTAEEIVHRFIEHLKFDLGKDEFSATPYDCYVSLPRQLRIF